MKSRLRAALIACLFVFACSSPDEFQPREPLRDSYPVQELWVVENLSETVSVVNLDRWKAGVTPHTVSPLFLAGRVPQSITAHEGKGYIVNSSGNSITVFNLRGPDQRYDAAIFPGANPWGIAVIRQGSIVRALVTCAINNSLAVVRIEGNGGWLERVIPLQSGEWPEGIASDGTRAWVAMSGWSFSLNGYIAGCVAVLDISADDVADWNVETSVPVAANPQALLLDTEADEVYVLSSGDPWGSGAPGGLAVLDATSSAVKREQPVSESFSALVLEKASGRLCLAGWGVLACYDAAALAPIPIQAFAGVTYADGFMDIALDQTGKFLYAADFANDRVLAYDLESGTFAGEFPCGDGPQALLCVTVE